MLQVSGFIKEYSCLELEALSRRSSGAPSLVRNGQQGAFQEEAKDRWTSRRKVISKLREDKQLYFLKHPLEPRSAALQSPKFSCKCALRICVGRVHACDLARGEAGPPGIAS